ncbi:MAG: integration host factor subunit beta [Geobacteraceae bacterium GWC2_53_11]|nr:MAG: integration host factor subunit beta [Geobacteraceae bacterium GWC2_53_11]
MTKSELIVLLAEKKNMNVSTAEVIIHEIFASMTETLINGDRIEIRGFGSFEIREYEGYSGRNPKTGIEVTVAPKKCPHFKVGRELRERILAGA